MAQENCKRVSRSCVPTPRHKLMQWHCAIVIQEVKKLSSSTEEEIYNNHQSSGSIIECWYTSILFCNYANFVMQSIVIFYNHMLS